MCLWLVCVRHGSGMAATGVHGNGRHNHLWNCTLRSPRESAFDSPEGKKDSIATMRIAIASDHAAIELKSALAGWLRDSGHVVDDLGPFDDARVDYPDYGYKLAQAIGSGSAERGVALCGSGIGISIAVNRHAACRCARVDDPLSAALSREHNDANVIALGARLVGVDMAKACITAFLQTEFAGGRHGPRVEKLSNPNFIKEPA